MVKSSITNPERLLANLVNYKLKLDEAPCSAESHFDLVVFLLSEMCDHSWVPCDQDVVKTINDSREHMAFYYKEAKDPWPKVLN